MNATISRVTIFEGSGCVLLARVVDLTGAYILQTDLDSITCKVYQGTTLIDEPTVVIADCVYDTLQTDSRWQKDLTGYNIAIPIPGTSFQTGNTVYRVEVWFNPATGGDPFAAVWAVRTINLQST